MDKWQKFEHLVASIKAQFMDENSTIQLNEKITGLITERKRQVDITIRQRIGLYDILIAIDCKDYKKPVDTKSIGEVSELMRDIGAHQGIIVSSNGFTKSAIKSAKDYRLLLYKLIDTGEHEWKIKIKIPFILQIKKLTQCQLQYQYITSTNFGGIPILSEEEQVIYSDKYEIIGNPLNLLSHWWEKNYDTVGVGITNNINFLSQKAFQKAMKGFVEVKINASLLVEEKVYFKMLELAQFSGFEKYDDVKLFLTKGFTTTPIDFTQLDKDWEIVENVNDLTIKPIIKMGVCAF